MSRNLKRVPLDFAAPLHEIWEGYLNPYKVEDCHLCDGNGHSPEYRALENQWFSWDKEEWIWISNHQRYNNKALQYHLEQADIDILWEENRLREYKEKPSVKEINEVYAHRLFGHDAINRWLVIKHRLEQQNLPYKCAHCNGSGAHDPAQLKQAESWEPIEPPQGEGYQLWEDCTEGSPISPVFSTLDDLCAYAEVHCTTFGSSKATKAQWKHMLEGNCVYHKTGNLIFM
jgi:hypothetical protein